MLRTPGRVQALLGRRNGRERAVQPSDDGAVIPGTALRNCDSQSSARLVEVRSDLDGVYLETAAEANVAYYTRNGFEVIGEFYPLGVRMWRMFANIKGFRADRKA